jgi:fluoride exporter
MILLYIGMGGLVGAILRYAISNKINLSLPYGTFFVNIIGSFVLGYLFYQGMSENMYAFLGIGFCGAFTTYSTFKLEAFQLIKSKGKIVSFTYLIMSYLCGIGFAVLGYLFANQ